MNNVIAVTDAAVEADDAVAANAAVATNYDVADASCICCSYWCLLFFEI
jgi:hypothetical protein